jgi:hypothetical protein
MSVKRNNNRVDPGSYTVGYGKPPVHSRFKAGASGNPKGRPRGLRNPPALIYEILNEKISVRMGDEVRHISKFAAMMQTLASKALKGDLKAIDTILALTMEYSSMSNPPQNSTMKIVFIGRDGSKKEA